MAECRPMSETELKADLKHHLQEARDAVLWKLDGLSEYDIRRPLTPTGTNLLGMVKHSTATHLAYFGEVFGRPSHSLGARFSEDADPTGEFWATPDESRADIVNGYRDACEF